MFDVLGFTWLHKLYMLHIISQASPGFTCSILFFQSSTARDGLHTILVINKSLTVSFVPDAWKCSLITPIPKIDNPIGPDDFRPINNLPIFEKILEQIAYEQIMFYLDENSILCEQQAGFRKCQSTESLIQSVLYDWMDAIEGKKKIISVFLDFRRAFETVSRKILLVKMRRYGFGEKAIKWFESFLSNRKQQTKVNNVISEEVYGNHGLPQGSKLANLLFILYINDLPSHLQNVKTNLYADDSLIYVCGSNLDEMANVLRDELNVVGDWLKYNSMALNHKKCNVMFLNVKNERLPQIKIDNECIEHASCVKYLGVWIDCKLSFDIHYQKLKSKINQRTGMLRRLNSKMTKRSKEIYLKSLILPLYDYCSSILMMLDKCQVCEIQKCINRAIRIVLSRARNDHVSPMLAELKVLPVSERIKLNAMRFIRTTISRRLPMSLFRRFSTRAEARARNLRSDEDTALPHWNISKFRKSIFYEGAKLFNECKKRFRIDEYFLFNCKIYIVSLNN